MGATRGPTRHHGSVTSRFGDGLALHDDLLVAAEEAVAAALAPLGGVRPDLACVFVTGGSAKQTELALAYASDLIDAGTSIGCGADGVMAAGKGIEGESGVSVWVAVLPDVSVRGFHLEVLRTSESIAVLGMPVRSDDDVVGVLLADPWSFPIDGFISHSDVALAGLPLVGGLASGATVAGGSRLLVDGRVVDRGAVGVVLGGELAVHTLVSQGCRPIGMPMTVTGSDGDTVLELAGRPAYQQAKDAISVLSPDEQLSAVRGLALGLAVDEYMDEHEQGDFLVRSLVSADPASGALSVGEQVAVGTTVQFVLRDAAAAHEDLAAVLAAFRRTVGLDGLAGALVFSCNSRGTTMFPSPDHDVTAVRGGLGVDNVAGFFAAGEIGPVGGRNHVHGFTATVLAFGS